MARLFCLTLLLKSEIAIDLTYDCLLSFKVTRPGLFGRRVKFVQCKSPSPPTTNSTRYSSLSGKTNYVHLHYVTRKRFLKIALVSKREHLPRKRELKYVKFNKSTKKKTKPETQNNTTRLYSNIKQFIVPSSFIIKTLSLIQIN